MLFLDYQATTPLAPEALEAMCPGSAGLARRLRNPSRVNIARPGAAVAVELSRSRSRRAAQWRQVHFTSGATEALNWALMRLLTLHRGVAGSAIEHHAAPMAETPSPIHSVGADGWAVASGRRCRSAASWPDFGQQ